MKKFLLIFISILFLSFSIFLNYDISHCAELNQPKNDIIYNYINNEVNSISSRIYLVSKSIVTHNTSIEENKKEEFLKDIKYITSDISSLILKIQNGYSQHSEDKYTLNELYSIALMLEEYRFSLVQLEASLNAITPEDQYSSLESFFIINSEANRKLNTAKSILNK